MRIASISNPGLVNSNYRAYQPMRMLARRGHEIWTNGSGETLTVERLAAYEAVHVHRVGTPEMQWLARQLRERGVGVVWDNDDDVGALPRHNPHYARLGPRGRRELAAGVAEMVRIADVVTTPSTVLAERYRDLGAADVRVLENHLPPELLGAKPLRHAGVVIACLAGLEHQSDYQALGIGEVLRTLMGRHADLRVLSMGVGHDLPADRCEHIPLAGFLDLARILARADVGLAPIADIPWNRARSNVKLKEYAAGGLCWLASPVGPYAGMGEAQGGRLVPDGGWEEAIERLIVNRRERRKLAKRAAKWVKGEGIERYAHRWEEALRDAAARARAQAVSREPATARR